MNNGQTNRPMFDISPSSSSSWSFDLLLLRLCVQFVQNNFNFSFYRVPLGGTARLECRTLYLGDSMKVWKNGTRVISVGSLQVKWKIIQMGEQTWFNFLFQKLWENVYVVWTQKCSNDIEIWLKQTDVALTTTNNLESSNLWTSKGKLLCQDQCTMGKCTSIARPNFLAF